MRNGTFPQKRPDQHALQRLARVSYQRLAAQSNVLRCQRGHLIIAGGATGGPFWAQEETGQADTLRDCR
jgi:hypothetical protein